MRTTKPVSTISFNSEGYLKVKLQELVDCGRLSFWAYIVHQPEDDEGGKKEHIHVYLEPSKMLQTDDLRRELSEFDPVTPDKPRGCLPFQSSRFDPWFMYAVHDRRYLAYKGQSRRFHYSSSDIQSSDADYLLFRIKSIDMLSLSPYADMDEAISSGLTWDEYFSRGTVPIALIRPYSEAWQCLVSAKTNRGNSSPHEMDVSEFSVDPETGEVTAGFVAAGPAASP